LRPPGGSAAGLALLALFITGCRDGDPALKAAQLPNLVLQRSDVPRAFTQFDEGEQGTADAPVGLRADAERFGRRGGWKARYRRADDENTGSLVLGSRADLFAASSGAQDDLEAFRADLGRARELPAPELGDAAVATTLRQVGIVDIRYYTVFWRFRNVTASVLVSGFEGRVTLADALVLARRQQQRIARAAGS
jgi:hypothetical protein